jgi:hypothetical protein
MAAKRPRTSAEQRDQQPSVAVDPTDSTEQLVAGTTIQCRSDSSNNSSAAQPAKPSAEQPVQVCAKREATDDACSRILMKQLRDDVEAWMPTSVLSAYFKLLAEGRQQEAYQLKRSDFSAYCFKKALHPQAR